MHTPSKHISPRLQVWHDYFAERCEEVRDDQSPEADEVRSIYSGLRNICQIGDHDIVKHFEALGLEWRVLYELGSNESNEASYIMDQLLADIANFTEFLSTIDDGEISPLTSFVSSLRTFVVSRVSKIQVEHDMPSCIRRAQICLENADSMPPAFVEACRKYFSEYGELISKLRGNASRESIRMALESLTSWYDDHIETAIELNGYDDLGAYFFPLAENIRLLNARYLAQ